MLQRFVLHLLSRRSVHACNRRMRCACAQRTLRTLDVPARYGRSTHECDHTHQTLRAWITPTRDKRSVHGLCPHATNAPCMDCAHTRRCSVHGDARGDVHRMPVREGRSAGISRPHPHRQPLFPPIPHACAHDHARHARRRASTRCTLSLTSSRTHIAATARRLRHHIHEAHAARQTKTR